MKLAHIACFFGVFCIMGVFPQAPEGSSQDFPVIQIRDGSVRGRRSRTIGDQTVYYAFQGIPYAEPPTGNRRFRPPEKKSAWKGVLNATQDKSQCIQGGNPPQGSEDCLYINVYTPNLKGRKLPVMAWIHGGGFNLGNSSYISYGPDYLLEKDIVFVSFNYRLGIYGFGSTEDSTCPGNFGFKDQILALKWVQDNVASFGGDPKKVTIFGGSAGSASVSYLLQTNLTRDLFRAGIMESGTSLCLWALDRRSRETMFAVGGALNVDTSSSTSLINGLRKINSLQLQDVAFGMSITALLDNLLNGLVYGLVKEPGVVDKYSELELSQGRFLRKPVIIGFTSSEAATVGGFPATVRQYFERYDNNISGLTPINLTRNSTKIMQAATDIKSFYFGTSPIAGQTEAIVKFISDDLFNRAVRRTVIDQSKYVSVYFYKFSYTGLLGAPNRSQEGAGHGEETSYLFRTYPNFTVSPDDIRTRSRMVKLWTNFAKFLLPTPSIDPLLENVIWLPSNVIPNNELYLDIDKDVEIKLNPFNKRMKFWDGIYKKYGDPPYDTY
ncbi:esterase FE4-like [Anoplophora glabripennis]|uniref:esterase FE4-like n=1 Tax=Anoplophora glabripennis TaxID=217634 RepID=UPI000873CC37|nr:esterase FE4-like [Anoplophora glabripennis]